MPWSYYLSCAVALVLILSQPRVPYATLWIQAALATMKRPIDQVQKVKSAFIILSGIHPKWRKPLQFYKKNLKTTCLRASMSGWGTMSIKLVSMTSPGWTYCLLLARDQGLNPDKKPRVLGVCTLRASQGLQPTCVTSILKCYRGIFHPGILVGLGPGK